MIGRRLIVLLRRAGHEVTGSTRSADKAPQLEASGVRPAIVDVFDAGALERAVAAAEPEGIIHQLTDLPHEPDRALIAAAAARNARLRIEGTRNLIDAALHADVRRVVAQASRSSMRRGRSRTERPIRSTRPARKRQRSGACSSSSSW